MEGPHMLCLLWASYSLAFHEKYYIASVYSPTHKENKKNYINTSIFSWCMTVQCGHVYSNVKTVTVAIYLL